ncbi:MAG: hypothetical protein JWN44_1777 [Myxococcales bacterium]|nr:hypothetical protein [Myxococcales bacterium]
MRKTPLTLGVLCIVFGGVTALWKGFGLFLNGMSGSTMKGLTALMGAAPRRPGQPDPSVMMAKTEQMVKALAPYTSALLAAMVLFSAALIVIGVGLYKRQSWARSGAIGWSVLALFYVVAEIVVQLTIIQPRTRAMMQEMFSTIPNGGGAMMQAVGSAQGAIVVVTALLFWAPFPIVLLILCGRRSAAADFVD